jgi:hypothetical protein
VTVTVTDWNIRILFDMLNDACTKLCKPFEHSAVDRCALQREIYFQAIQSKKHRCCKLCDMADYTFDMTVYLGNLLSKCLPTFSPEDGSRTRF